MTERRTEAAPDPRAQPVALLSWIWRSYVRNALVPLLIVEVMLVAVYVASHAWSRHSNTEALREVARSEVIRVARDESSIIQQELTQVSNLTEVLRRQAAVALQRLPAVREDRSRYRLGPGGVLTTHSRDGGAAVFYSALTPKGPAEWDKVARTAALDDLLRDIVMTNPLIVQAYFNSHDSLNRIWPWLDAATQFDPYLDIPRFNFYYEADAKHNPRRAVVWTDAYVDPAGQGWMVSAIAPVYRGDFLEGTVGADVRLREIIDSVLDSPIPWDGFILLAGKDGTLLALPPAAEQFFDLSELVDYDYVEALASEIFKPEEFNLLQRPDFAQLAEVLKETRQGFARLDGAAAHLVAWDSIPLTGWQLIVMVPEARVFEPAESLADRLAMIGWILLGGLVGFYALFFTFLFWRARRVATVISAPLREIEGISRRVAGGEYELRPAGFEVIEFQQTLDALVRMGAVLGEASRARAAAEQQLKVWNEQLSELFNFSPSGVVSFAPDGTIALVNPAFLNLTGWAADELVGIRRDPFWARLSAVAAGAELPPPEGVIVEFQLGGPGGRIVDCRVIRSPGRGELAYFRDVTESRELDHVKSQFLATAAHELRTPMAVIGGTVEYLQSVRPPPAEAKSHLATIQRHAGHIQGIIAELLDLARIEAGAGREFQRQRQPFMPVLAEFVSTFRLGNDPRRPSQTGSTGIAEAEFDADKICQALGNVLSNAYKYSPPGSPIAVEWRLAAGEVGVTVRDQGDGMDAEVQARICDRFYRGEAAAGVPGTGLGMSIVSEIIALHGGRIEIQSEKGRGSAVTLWLSRAGSG